ncbi:MAG: O-antigen ligase family protein [Thermoguttaceae bacterium]|nr:O-antigen ligase family protein [Thermoguttaceae bacterium]
MLSRFSVFWYGLFVVVMLSSASASAYAEEREFDTLLPQTLVHYIGLLRWVFWIVFVGEGLITTVKWKDVTSYHRKFLLFYAILLLSALGEITDPHRAIVLNGLARTAGLLCICLAIPLQLENYIRFHGIDKTLRTFFYCVVIMTVVGVLAGLRARGFSFRYTGWVDNPNSFVLINVFFISVLLANYVRKSVPRGICVPLIIFLVFAQLSTGSRQGLIGLLVVALVFAVRSGQGARTWFFVLSILIVGFVLFFVFGSEGARRVFDVYDVENDTGRLNHWTEVWPYIRQKWLTGWSINGREYLEWGNSHNMYISLMLFFGIPGGVLMGAYYAYCCAQGLFAKEKRGDLASVAFIFTGYLCSVFATMAVEDTILGIGSPWSLQIVLAIGMVNALQRLQRGGEGGGVKATIPAPAPVAAPVLTPRPYAPPRPPYRPQFQPAPNPERPIDLEKRDPESAAPQFPRETPPPPNWNPRFPQEPRPGAFPPPPRGFNDRNPPNEPNNWGPRQ